MCRDCGLQGGDVDRATHHWNDRCTLRQLSAESTFSFTHGILHEGNRYIAQAGLWGVSMMLESDAFLF